LVVELRNRPGEADLEAAEPVRRPRNRVVGLVEDVVLEGHLARVAVRTAAIDLLAGEDDALAARVGPREEVAIDEDEVALCKRRPRAREREHSGGEPEQHSRPP
jgi:cytidylate kinase